MESSTTVKRIVCLANSRKEGDRCIAGKELLEGDAWAAGYVPSATAEMKRLIHSSGSTDHSEPRVLDVIGVPVLEARPSTYPENWLLDPHSTYPHPHKVCRFTFEDLLLTDPTGPLWIDGHSGSNGRNDRIPLYLANALDSSLCLIQVDRLELSTSNAKHKQKVPGVSPYRVQGRFRCDGVEYRLSVTDPIYEQAYGQRPNSRYTLDACFLTVSLGGAHKNFAYKLIAAIIASTEPTRTDMPIEDTAQIPLFIL